MKKQFVLAVITGGFVMIAGVFYSCSFQKDQIAHTMNTDEVETATLDQTKEPEPEFPEDTESKHQDIDTQEVSTDLIYIHLCGAVQQPDVYKVTKGTRLIDVIRQAGGLTPDSAGDYINQAQLVMDGQRIYIPTKEEVKNRDAEELIRDNDSQNSIETQVTDTTNHLININEAELNDLMKLPGVGQAKAQSIIEYRNTKGKFQKVEDLMKIKGIKEGLFQKIASLITI